MTSLALMQTDSMIARLDPRVRLVTACLWSIILALVQQFAAALAGLFFAVCLCIIARLSWSGLKLRLISLNGFIFLLFLTLPWSVPGSVGWSLGPIPFTREGVALAALIGLKSNAILLTISALISTIPPTALGHAMEHLRVPARFAHLFLFSVRYVEQMYHENQRLARSARARAFTPGFNRLTYTTYARWLSMLFIRGLDRSERVLAAMKARGYQGRFYLLNHFRAGPRDAAFGGLMFVAAVALIWMEWL